MANKYFVYIGAESERGCPKYDSLDEALRKYNETKMTEMSDSVYLGIEGNSEHDGYYCFDVLHKFFNDNILINDYLNHTEAKDIMKVAQEIINSLFIRYQWVSDILNGVLIDYDSPFVGYQEKEINAEWNEAYLSTYADGEMNIVGWVEPNRETYNKYSWNYPKTASYISMMNIGMYDDKGYRYDVDVDPRVYLQLLGKRVSVK